MVNSLGPLGIASTGGASPPGVRNTSVVDPGRFINVWSIGLGLTGARFAAGIGGGVREKNGSTGGTTGCEIIPPRGCSGGDDPDGSRNDGLIFGFVPSVAAPNCDPVDGFPEGISRNISVNDPGAVDCCSGSNPGDGAGSPRPISSRPNILVKSPTGGLVGAALPMSGTSIGLLGAPGCSNGSRKKLVNSPVPPLLSACPPAGEAGCEDGAPKMLSNVVAGDGGDGGDGEAAGGKAEENAEEKDGAASCTGDAGLPGASLLKSCCDTAMNSRVKAPGSFSAGAGTQGAGSGGLGGAGAAGFSLESPRNSLVNDPGGGSAGVTGAGGVDLSPPSGDPPNSSPNIASVALLGFGGEAGGEAVEPPAGAAGALLLCIG